MNRIIFIFIILLAVKVGAQTPALAISDSLFAVGDSRAAIELLEEISGKTPAVYSKLAKYHSAAGNLHAALSNYEILLSVEPGRVLSTMGYAATLKKTGRLKEADSIYSELSQSYPKNADFVYQKGIVREMLKDSSAINYFKQVIQIDGTHAEALYRLAKHELQRKQHNMAIFYSQMGLEYHPRNVSLLSILSQAYFRQEKYKQAIPGFEMIIAEGHGNEFVHSRLGFAYYHELDYPNAVAHYKLALEIEDRNSDTHYNLGKLYALLGDLEKSELHLMMAIMIKKQPVDAEYLSLGLTYKLQRDYKKAIEYFNKALDENIENERALYERAIAADNYLKDPESRLSHYQSYLNRYENSGNQTMVKLAQIRLSDIKKELHLTGE